VGSAILIRSIQATHSNDLLSETGNGLRDGPGAARRVTSEIADGVRVVWGDRLLRAVVSCSTLISLFGFIFMAVYILFMTGVLRLTPVAIGVILGAGGVGAVIGAAMAVPLSRKFGFGPTLIWAQVIFAVMGITVPIAVYVPSLAVPMLALSEFAQYGAFAVYTVGQVSLRQARTPDALQGRAAASVRTAVSGAAFAGSLLGGILGERIGLGQTLVVGVAGMALACGFVLVSPLWSLRDLSESSPARAAD
jgi:predicted MFS family arabinose efflux permease